MALKDIPTAVWVGGAVVIIVGYGIYKAAQAAGQAEDKITSAISSAASGFQNLPNNLLTSTGQGIGNFFSSIGNGIADAIGSFFGEEPDVQGAPAGQGTPTQSSQTQLSGNSSNDINEFGN